VKFGYECYLKEAEMATAKSHRELRVYQLSLSFPSEEKYSLTDQIRRSSRSVCSNIAEAWRRRKYPKNFVSKLTDADSEATETIVWLDFALHFKYISTALHKELEDHYDHINSQLTIMMSDPGKWTPRTNA
jgi:four helix bundle protein